MLAIDLCAAAEAGDVTKVKEILEKSDRVSVNSRNRVRMILCLHRILNWIYYTFFLQHGETPVHRAAGSGEIEVIRFLQEKGADLKAVDKV